MVKGSRVGCGGRGDLGVRFDRLNELRDGKVFEFVEFDLSTFRHPSTFRSFDKLRTPQAQGTAYSGTKEKARAYPGRVRG